MRKKLFAAFCIVTMFASTAPIFAADPTSTNTVVLTPDQIAKLDSIQSQLNDLLTKIDDIKNTYKGTGKGKGLLVALDQFKKQANKLNTTVTNYKNNPTAHADKRINAFQHKTKQLQWKVTVTEKILKKINTPHKKPVKNTKHINHKHHTQINI